jgi:hypothetical protein
MSESLTVLEQEVLTISDETTELLEVAMQGPPGPPGGGGGGSGYYTFPANGAVSGHKVMRVSSGLATVCTTNDTMYAHNIVGISMNAAADGDPVNIRHSGEMVEPSWNWMEERPVFMGGDGRLTQAVSVSGLSIIVATVLTPTKIIVDIRQPIIVVQIGEAP